MLLIVYFLCYLIYSFPTHQFIVFFLFISCVVFNNFFTVPLEIENVRLRLALAISTSAQITVANDTIEIQQLKIHQCNQKKQCIY